MGQSRVYKWDNLKVFMIIGIVLEHSLIIYNYPRNLELIWAGFISCLMPLFTLISGYWHKPKAVQMQVKSYLKPMLLFSGVNFAIGYIFYPAYHSGFHFVGYAMWYFGALFVFSIVSPYLLRFVRLRLLLLLSMFLVFLFCLFPAVGRWESLLKELQINRLVGFYPFYILGICIRRYEKEIRAFVKPVSAKYLLLITFVVYLFLCYRVEGLEYKSAFYLTTGSSLSLLLQWLISYLFITIISLALVFIVKDKEYFFTKYGARSITVYALHMLIVFPLSWGLFFNLPHTPSYELLNAVLVSALGLFLFNKRIHNLVDQLLKIPMSGAILIYIASFLLVNYSFIAKIVHTYV